MIFHCNIPSSNAELTLQQSIVSYNYMHPLSNALNQELGKEIEGLRADRMKLPD